MKKVYSFFFAVILTAICLAQAPQKMSYQAVIRDAGNALVTSHAAGMRISILQGSASGTAVYVETQSPTTNVNGLVTLEIGGGTPITGTFEGIDWSTGVFFIKTETDPAGGTSYSITVTSQLLSVPYALYSKTSKTANYNDLTNKLSAGTGININESNQIINTAPDKTVSIIGQNEITVTGTYPNFVVSGTTTHIIGESYGGGIVFYVTFDGQHGLIAEPQELRSIWYDAQDAINNPNNHSTAGKNYTDWRLPTKYELNVLYGQKTIVGGFTELYYWSSTEEDNNNAWYQRPDNGNQAYNLKTLPFWVRAIRTF